jgi:hypothetical protein
MLIFIFRGVVRACNRDLYTPDGDYNMDSSPSGATEEAY